MTRDELLKVLKVGSVVRTTGERLCMVEAVITEDGERHPVRLKDLFTHEVVECGLGDITQVMTDVGETTPETSARSMKSTEKEAAKDTDQVE